MPREKRCRERTPQLEALSLGPGPPTIHQHMAPGMGLFEMQHHDRPTTRSLPKPPATPHMQPTWAENLRHRFAPPRARLGLHPWTQPRSALPTSPNPYSSRGRPPQPAHFPSHPIRSRRRPPNPRPGPQRLVSTRPATPTHPPFTKQLVLCAAPPGRSKAFAPSNSWNLEQPSHRLPTLGSIGAQSTASLPDPVATYRPHTNNPPTHRNDQPPTTSTTWSLPSRPSHPSGVPRTIRHPRPLILGLRPSHPTRRIHTSHSPRDATPSLPWGTWRFSHSNTRRPVAGTTTRNTTAPTWSCATTRRPNSRDRPPHSVCKQHPPSGTRRAAQCGPTGAHRSPVAATQAATIPPLPAPPTTRAQTKPTTPLKPFPKILPIPGLPAPIITRKPSPAHHTATLRRLNIRTARAPSTHSGQTTAYEQHCRALTTSTSQAHCNRNAPSSKLLHNSSVVGSAKPSH